MIGYVIQDVGLFPHFTVARNIGLVPQIENWPSDRIRQRVEELLKLVGLDQSLGMRYPRELSGGQRQRVGVARAIAMDPRFVLLDEPAAGLPEAEVPDFATVLREVRDVHSAGVLLIDHNMALIMEVCDRIHVLDQGRTLAEGTPDEIRANLDVAAAYLGESAVHETGDGT